MRVAILGAGAIGFGGAALLSERGHDPALWSPSGRSTVQLAAGEPLVATGALAGTFRPRVAASCEEALADAEAALIALPANGHRAVLDAAAPHIRADQTVIISGHLSFGALYLSRKLAERGVRAPIVAWGTTVTTGRRRGLAAVNLGLRAKVDIATVPASAAERGLQVCQALFGDRFVPRADLLAIAVSNLNPQNHMGIALLNLTRMEKGEEWGQNENMTEALARLLEALDRERLAIAAAIGVEVRTIREHFHLSFGVPMGTMDEMSRFLRERGAGVSGPKSLDTRYILEDVPFGLVPTERLGRLAGRPAVLHESGINLLSAIYGRDFRAENDLLPALGIHRLCLADLRALCRDGYGKRT